MQRLLFFQEECKVQSPALGLRKVPVNGTQDSLASVSSSVSSSMSASWMTTQCGQEKFTPAILTRRVS